MPGPFLTANQSGNGDNGGYTPPNYLQYRSPVGTAPGGTGRPAISPPALTGTGMQAFTPGFGGYNPSYGGSPSAAQQVAQNNGYLSGSAPTVGGNAPPTASYQNYAALLGQLATGA